MPKSFVHNATLFSVPAGGVAIDRDPGRDGAVMFYAGVYSHAGRAAVRVVTIDCYAPTGPWPGWCPPSP